MDIAKGQIGNALTSTAQDHVVAVANDIYDETQEKYQSEINAEIESKKVLPFGGIVDDVTISTGTLPRTPDAESIFFDKTKGHFVARVWVIPEPTLGGSSQVGTSLTKFYKAWNGSDKYNKVTDSGIVPACNSFIDITTLSSEEIESLLNAKADKTDLENVLYFDEEIDAPDDKDVIDKVNDLASDIQDLEDKLEGDISLSGDSFEVIVGEGNFEISNNGGEDFWHGISVNEGVLKLKGDSTEISAYNSLSINGDDEIKIGNDTTKIDLDVEDNIINIVANSLNLNGEAFTREGRGICWVDESHFYANELGGKGHSMIVVHAYNDKDKIKGIILPTLGRNDDNHKGIIFQRTDTSSEWRVVSEDLINTQEEWDALLYNMYEKSTPLSAIASKADKTYVDSKIGDIGAKIGDIDTALTTILGEE